MVLTQFFRFLWPTWLVMLVLMTPWPRPALSQTPPKTAVQWYNQGVDKLSDKKYQEAIKDFNESINLNDQDADAFYNRGYAYHILGDYDKALADYDQALRLNPKFAYALGNRCYAYYLTKQYDKAINDCSAAIKLNNKYADRCVLD